MITVEQVKDVLENYDSFKNQPIISRQMKPIVEEIVTEYLAQDDWDNLTPLEKKTAVEKKISAIHMVKNRVALSMEEAAEMVNNFLRSRSLA